MELKKYLEILKLVVFVGIIAGIGFGGFAVYRWIDNKLFMQQEMMKAELDANRKFLELKINQARAETTIVPANSSDWKSQMDELKKENAKLIDLIKENNEKIKNIGEITAKANENLSRQLRVVSDHVYKPGTGDINEQYFKKITAKEADADGKITEIPIGWAIYYPNKPEDERWKVGIYPLEYKTKVVQTEQTDGQWNTYVETWAENNKDKESKGKKLPLKIETAEFTQVKKTDKEFYWWAPHLNLNVDVGFGLGSFSGGSSDSSTSTIVAGGLSFSAMGYGRTKNDLSFRFLDFGVSTNGSDTYAKFTPFTWNIGDVLPLISNTHIGPFIGYGFTGDSKGDLLFGIGLSIPF
jgi:hypothetical protein